MNLLNKTKFRAGTQLAEQLKIRRALRRAARVSRGETPDRQRIEKPLRRWCSHTATCARQRGNSQQFDCHAEGSQAAHANILAVGIPDINNTGSRSEPSSQTAPPCRVSPKLNLNSRSRRSFAKRPELNRASFVFASTTLHKVKQLQQVSCFLQFEKRAITAEIRRKQHTLPMPKVYLFSELWRIFMSTTQQLLAQAERLFRHNRQGSYKTRERYAEAFSRFCRYIGDEFRVQKRKNIAPKHVRAYVAYIQAREQSASTIKTELSAIRFWYAQIPEAQSKLPPNSDLNLERRSFGKVDHTWSSRA